MESRLSKPIAREKALVVEELGDELLVYDLEVKNAHCLTPLAAGVWRLCDGRTDTDAMASQLGVEVSEIQFALDELDRCDLLQTMKAKKAGLSRRDFGLKVTKVAAAGATLPLILSIAAPAMAASASVIIYCFSLTPDGGTNNCNICNQQTGANTLCCCCHQPTRTQAPAITPGLKACAADAHQCCCPSTQTGDNQFNWSVSKANPAHHCTEPDGTKQLCADYIAAGGCNDVPGA
jgi:hypothetical protein